MSLELSLISNDRRPRHRGHNYVFDPSVRLQRFAYQAHRSLLIDEAHQLGNRINDMLSVEISFCDVYAALEEAPQEITESLVSSRPSWICFMKPQLRRGTQFVLIYRGA